MTLGNIRINQVAAVPEGADHLERGWSLSFIIPFYMQVSLPTPAGTGRDQRLPAGGAEAHSQQDRRELLGWELKGSAQFSTIARLQKSGFRISEFGRAVSEYLHTEL